jgi:hypothetical protein
MPGPAVTIDTCTLYQGDALAILPTLPPASVQLLICDPPYFKTKMDYLGEKVTWDRQWPTREAYLAWLRQLAKEWQHSMITASSVAPPRVPALPHYTQNGQEHNSDRTLPLLGRAARHGQLTGSKDAETSKFG